MGLLKAKTEIPVKWKLSQSTLMIVAIGVLGILLLLLYSKTEIHFFESSGDALVVASILALTVDRYLKQKFVMEELPKLVIDGYEHFAGYEFPPEMQEHIRTLLLTQIVRRDLNLSVRLTPSKIGANTVIVDAELSYSVVNLRKLDVPYEQHFEHDKQPEFLELQCDSNDKSASYWYKGAEVKPESLDGGMLAVTGPKVFIKASNEDRQIKYRFIVRYRFEDESREDESLVITHPTIRASVSAEDPTGGTAFRNLTPEPSGSSGVNTWQYSRIFLPEETFGVRWWPHKITPLGDTLKSSTPLSKA